MSFRRRIKAWWRRLWERIRGKDEPDIFGERGTGKGFLWKPLGENSKKLVILFPPLYTGRIQSAILRRESGMLIEIGQPSGVANGNREHFRFAQPGAAYGTRVMVCVRLDNGKQLYWPVANGAQRYEE